MSNPKDEFRWPLPPDFVPTKKAKFIKLKPSKAFLKWEKAFIKAATKDLLAAKELLKKKNHEQS